MEAASCALWARTWCLQMVALCAHYALKESMVQRLVGVQIVLLELSTQAQALHHRPAALRALLGTQVSLPLLRVCPARRALSLEVTV